jgi:hypothetical protein
MRIDGRDDAASTRETNGKDERANHFRNCAMHVGYVGLGAMGGALVRRLISDYSLI